MHEAEFSRYTPRGGLLAGLAKLAHAPFNPGFWRVPVTFVSVATTAYGGHLLYNSGGEAGALGPFAILLPIAAACLLHAIIFNLLARTVEKRRASLLAVVIALQMVAAIASFGPHWQHLNGSAQTVASFDQAVRDTVRGTGLTTATYRAVADNLQHAFEYSSTQAGIEEKQGGTCGVSREGGGPRTALRLSDRRDFERERNVMQALLQRFTALQTQAEALSAESASDARHKLRQLEAILNRAREAEAAPQINNLRSFLEQRRALGRGAIPVPDQFSRPGAPTTFTCPDAVLDREIDRVLDAISHLRQVPEIAFRDTTDPKEAYSAAIGRLFGEIRALVQSGDRSTGPRLTSADWVALCLAIAIELLLLVSFLVSGKAPAGSRPMSEDRDLRRTVDQISDDQPDELHVLWQAAGSRSEFWAALSGWIDWTLEGATISLPIDELAEARVERAFKFSELLVSSALATRTEDRRPHVVLRIFKRKQARVKRTYELSNDQINRIIRHSARPIFPDERRPIPFQIAAE